MEAAETSGNDPDSPPATIQRACDQCRLRKIRCDKESPCSSCRNAKRPCSSTGAGQKPKEPRQRVLISSQYERKIDQIEERLASIERLLRNLNPFVAAAASPGTVATQGVEPQYPPPGSSVFSPLQQPPTLVPAPRSTSAAGQVDKPTPSSSGREDRSTIFDPEDAENFEGNSSLTAHTVFASEFLADAVQRTSLGHGHDPKIEAALSSLRQIVDMQNRKHQQRTGGDTFSGGENGKWSSPQKHVPKTDLKDLPLPPMALVVEKLKEIKHGPVPVILAIIYCFMDIDRFTDQCRRLYFCTEDVSEAGFILINAGLIYVFFEAGLSAADAREKAQYAACRDMCQRNLEIALAQLNLMMPATPENIEALLMGASFCIDDARASLAWLLVSQAAHMCRTLGWHQAQTTAGDAPQTRADKALLFWCTYMLDKALSLRLGRAAVLQDYDISLAPSVVAAGVRVGASASYPGPQVMALWIQHARVLGRIYERLYSPGALRQPDAARADQVRVLAAEQRRLMAASTGLLREFERAAAAEEEGRGPGAKGGCEARMFALALKSDEVSYLSTLVLTYRALPLPVPVPVPGAQQQRRSRVFADECIDLARAAIRCHLEAMAMMDNQSLKMVYIHWTILYAPFIPFIVIFCLVIETSDAEGDLGRLRDFVASLASARDVSPSVEKLFQLCQVLYNVALLYVEAKAREQREQQQQQQQQNATSGEFDLYLSQLGFMPFVGGSGSATASGGGDGGGDMALDSEMGMDDHQQMRSIAQTNQLGDWFSGNNYMMGLLEEDLSGINPLGWS
ncbi:hypothetical protein F4809DRAFT_651742 [Biscogniauxia mediterranea]|nr:hypothetical protein F4809DRAFT_651742 [Biscogniauxia mediterranea]